MELRSTREMRRNEQIDRVMAAKAERSGAPAKTQSAPKRAAMDKVSLSRQALSWLEEQNRKLWEQDRDRQQSGTDSAELDLLGKAMDIQEKCLKIAMSIMKGNRVPPEDLEYLMKNDPEGYKLAMALRWENKDAKDEKSVLDDGDKNGSAQESGGGEAAPAVEASGASSGDAPAET